MTDQNAQEPTMEEILASIRRIISEDDAPAETVAAADVAPEEPVVDVAPEPVPTAAPEEDVLELTDRYEAPTAIGDIDLVEAVVEPEPVQAAEPAPAPSYDALVGESAAASAASAFAGLASNFRKPEPVDAYVGTGPTIDALARELLRPMLKEWLEANLPGIVEAQVRKEVERIARNAG